MDCYISSDNDPGCIKDDFSAFSFSGKKNMKMVLFSRFRKFTGDSWDRERKPGDVYEARSESRGNQPRILYLIYYAEVCQHHGTRRTKVNLLTNANFSHNSFWIT
jgi:hypothetical protein